MKPLKIIELAFLSENKSPNCPPKDSDDYLFASWAGLFAKRLINFNPDLDIETWRAKDNFENIKEKIVYNVKAVIWPYKKPVIKNVLTYDMIIRLYKLQKNYFVIIHYHTLFDIRFIFFTKLLFKGINVVLSHHGGILPQNRKIKNILYKMFLKKTNIKYVTYLTPETKNLIKKIKNHPPLEFLPVGADFNLHCGGDKLEARKKIGLEKNRIYALYVGSFYKLKSVEVILDIFNTFKNKYNFEIIFVGGAENEENDLYNEVINSGCPNFGHTKSIDMPKFYQASDFYIHPALNPEFGGFDVSLIESLANNRPVISSRLNYFDFDYSELGVFFKDKDDIFDKTEYMINNYNKFKRCREVSEKYLDGNKSIIGKIYDIYKNIYDSKLKNNKI